MPSVESSITGFEDLESSKLTKMVQDGLVLWYRVEEGDKWENIDMDSEYPGADDFEDRSLDEKTRARRKNEREARRKMMNRLIKKRVVKKWEEVKEETVDDDEELLRASGSARSGGRTSSTFNGRDILDFENGKGAGEGIIRALTRGNTETSVGAMLSDDEVIVEEMLVDSD